MENFENNWKKIINSDADSSFHPDKAKIWDKIKTNQKKEQKIFPWVTHIAAVVAGILITLTFLFLNQKPQQKIAANKKSTNFPIVIHDTVKQTIVAVSHLKREKHPLNYLLQQRHSQKVKDNSQPFLTPKKYQVEDIITSNKPDTKTINTMKEDNDLHLAKAQPIKPIYLEDIDNNTHNNSRKYSIETLINSKFSAITYTQSPNPIDVFKSLIK